MMVYVKNLKELNKTPGSNYSKVVEYTVNIKCQLVSYILTMKKWNVKLKISFTLACSRKKYLGINL